MQEYRGQGISDSLHSFFIGHFLQMSYFVRMFSVKPFRVDFQSLKVTSRPFRGAFRKMLSLHADLEKTTVNYRI